MPEAEVTVLKGVTARPAAGQPPLAVRSAHPLGPLVYRSRVGSVRQRRATGSVLVLAAVAVVGLAAWLRPSPYGLGTHEQLGLPPCNLVLMTGYPCPTCGMTTAFAHTVRGQWLSAASAQPAGFVLALLTLLVGALGLDMLVTGRGWAINWYRVPPGRVVLAAVAWLLGSWLYKIWAVGAFG